MQYLMPGLFVQFFLRFVADLRLKFFASLMLIMVVIIGTLLIVHIGADGLRPSFFGPSIVRYKSDILLYILFYFLNLGYPGRVCRIRRQVLVPHLCGAGGVWAPSPIEKAYLFRRRKLIVTGVDDK